MIPYKKRAYKLLHEGAIALAQVEKNGIKIDTKYLKNTKVRIEKKIKRLESEMKQNIVIKTWKRVYGFKTNFNSNDQLGSIIFKHLELAEPTLTEGSKNKSKKRYKTDEKTLKAVDHPFVKKYLRVRKLKKILSTYVKGIQKEVVDGFIHPFFNLNTVKTFRSSCDSPNFQNIPVRDKESQKLVRTAIIARPGNQLVEIDYKGIEVAVAATHHKDPTMIEYLNDKSKDMHRDMAMECFKLPLTELTIKNKRDKDEIKRIKDIRYSGKNSFVFPQFYGSIHPDCAMNLWEAIGAADLKTRKGTPLKKYLRKKGIKRLGDCVTQNKYDQQPEDTFVRHIEKVQKRFWEERFPVYAKWKTDWYYKYIDKGYMLTKTGFICQGYMERNKIINYPIQGSAFHCLLWSLTKLVRVELRKHKMKSLIVGQIHDSIVADVPTEELNDFLVLANNVTTKQLVNRWKWINVPMEVEFEVSPVGRSWADKTETEIPG